MRRVKSNPSSFILAGLLLSAALSMSAALVPGTAAAQVTTRVSVAMGGGDGNGMSIRPSISADGRYVAFSSAADNLVTGDTNDCGDVFVRDRVTGITTRVSVDSDGIEGNDDSFGILSISADGRYVAFYSDATNLVAGDNNGVGDVFVHDRLTGTTSRVSVDSGGIEGDDFSYDPSISADGRYVAFHSDATNLVAGDANGATDVFVHDRVTGTTTRMSVDSGGIEGNDDSWAILSISADGRYVAFDSLATNLVAGDTNGATDVFVRDRNTDTTTRVSVTTSNGQGNGYSADPSISADGRYVAFWSYADNLVAGDTNGDPDVFVRDLVAGTTSRVNLATDGSQTNGSVVGATGISADGRLVVFGSNASDLVPDDTNGARDTFVHDRNSGATTRVSVATGGGEGNNDSGETSLSADGRHVAFDSLASNLVVGDSNGFLDIFVHDLLVRAAPAAPVPATGTLALMLLALGLALAAAASLRRRSA